MLNVADTLQIGKNNRVISCVLTSVIAVFVEVPGN